MIFIGLLGIALLVFLIWIAGTDKQLEKEAKKEQERQEVQNAWESEWKARQDAYNAAKSKAIEELEARWGPCTKDIYVDYSKEFTLKDRIYVFETAEKIVLDGNCYDFKDIIGFSLINKSKTIYNAYTTMKSQKDLGGMIVRGVAGKMIGGDVGAIIGAMSADEECDYETEYDSEIENEYKIYINVNSIASPTITLNIGDEEDDAYEIANLLNVIMTRNRITA